MTELTTADTTCDTTYDTTCDTTNDATCCNQEVTINDVAVYESLLQNHTQYVNEQIAGVGKTNKIDNLIATREQETLDDCEQDEEVDFYARRKMEKARKQAAVLNSLKDNPIFARTCKTLERLEAGVPIITVSEYKERYGGHMNNYANDEGTRMEEEALKVLQNAELFHTLRADDSIEDEHAAEYADMNAHQYST